MYKKKYIKFKKSKNRIKEIFRFSDYYLMMCIIVSDIKSVMGQKFFVSQQFKEYGRFHKSCLTHGVLNLLKNKFEKSVNII